MAAAEPTGVPTATAGPGMYTCVTCHVAFRSADDQRSHYKTDWHRYNLKRKVANMQPVDRNDFNARVLAQQAKEQLEAEQARYTGYCDVCRKSYATENAYNNHLLSNRHRENAAKKAQDGEPATAAPAVAHAEAAKAMPVDETPATETPAYAAASGAVVASMGASAYGVSASEPAKPRNVKADVLARLANQVTALSATAEPGQELTEEDELALIDQKIANARFLKPSECLFCCKDSGTLDRNMQHMAREHSFFVPDMEYVVDLPGLIQYLGEKVSVGNICLHCNGRGRTFHSLEAVQKHMIDKGHCKMAYEGDAELEYSDYYDFRPSYPDNDGTEELREGDEVAARSSGCSAVITEDETELILPSGVRLGHRALNRYYKQKFRPPETRDSVLVASLMSQYRALGWTKQPAVVKRDVQTYRSRLAAWDMKVGVKANKLQTHFRHQVIF